MNPTTKIYIPGHRGLTGVAIVRVIISLLFLFALDGILGRLIADRPKDQAR